MILFRTILLSGFSFFVLNVYPVFCQLPILKTKEVSSVLQDKYNHISPIQGVLFSYNHPFGHGFARKILHPVNPCHIRREIDWRKQSPRNWSPTGTE